MDKASGVDRIDTLKAYTKSAERVLLLTENRECILVNHLCAVPLSHSGRREREREREGERKRERESL